MKTENVILMMKNVLNVSNYKVLVKNHRKDKPFSQ